MGVITLNLSQNEWFLRYQKPINYLVVVVSLFFLSLSPIIVRYAQAERVPSILIAGSRMILASLLITPIVVRYYASQLRAITRADVFLLALTGIWMSANGILVIISLEHIPVLTNQMLASTAPIWAALIEVTWLKARLHPLIWVGIGLVVTGSLLITILQADGGNTDVSLLGVVLALLSAICGAIYTAIGRRVRPKVSILPYLWVVYGVGGIFALSIVLLTQVQVFGYSASGYAWIGASTILVQLLGFSGMAYALAFFPATVIVLSTRAVAIPASIFAFLLFSEVPTWIQVIGSVILFAGIISAIVGQEVADYRAKAFARNLQGTHHDSA
ncbi:MAG: DMT family transporter [Aggregatilineales bacterium]